MLTRFGPDFVRQFNPLTGPLVCSADDGAGGEGGGGGGEDGNITLSRKAFDARIKRAQTMARKKLLEEYEVTEDELAAIVASKGQDTKPEGDKKPEPERKPKAQAFDPEAFKADLLKSVGETLKSALTERETAAQQQAAAAAEKAARRAAAEKAGVKVLDLALPLFETHLASLDEEKRKTANPETFFADLLKAHPTFGAVKETPADSGQNGNDKPDPAKTQGGVKFDAQKAKPAEVQARMNEIRAKVAGVS